ncbi:MAG: hypothetical protein A2086_10720 [Spirochaetes bacterium GWD1_27_9]|nr:MAG: hypothetical protein A2Y34_01255 [Spirochaetes bacterium GWC1_27_15]OHD35176.1 MAG: hypothetical protein A2086_10720 [Spirochaetes bacterium GWD1_27_9]
MSERIFITGGAGFIGSNVAEYYSTKGIDVVVYDNLKSGFRKNIEKFSNITFIDGDILNYNLLKESMKNSTKVFHFGAEISVPLSMKNPELTEQINTIGTINTLKSMVENNIKTIIFASSAAVYGDNPEVPKTVSMPPNPISPYAISKLSGEYYLNMFVREHKIKATTTRFFNVFGERQNPFSSYAAAVPIFITKALKNEQITIFGDGEQTRDFIYVKDLVSYLIWLSSYNSGTYNIGYGNFITINELAKSIIQYTNSKSEIVYLPPREGDIKHSYANIGELKDIKIDLIGFKKGLANTIDYFIENV